MDNTTRTRSEHHHGWLEHGSRIITALEAAWAAIRARHPEIPGVVIVTGAGSNQRGVPEGYRLRGPHWSARWVTSTIEERDGELFIVGELLAAGGRAVIEVMLHEAAHALAAVRGIKDTSAEGNRYHTSGPFSARAGPAPRKLHLTPKQIEDGPVICGLCCAPFEAPREKQDEEP